jgi:hypothetical protein
MKLRRTPRPAVRHKAIALEPLWRRRREFVALLESHARILSDFAVERMSAI